MSGLPDKELVIVGLGNPGRKYEMTRHNVGAIVVQAMAMSLGWTLKSDKKLDVAAARGVVEPVRLHLVTPELFMNDSGRAVKKYLDYFGFRPKSLVVVVDDTDLPFGMLRFRSSGSAGSHNGLKSIQLHVGGNDYMRLRVGIGQKHERQELADYVLGRFNSEEVGGLPKVIDDCLKALSRLLKEDAVAVMNDINKKIKPMPGREVSAESTQESDNGKSGE